MSFSRTKVHLIHLEIENVVREVETADEMLLRHAPWSDRSTTTILNKGGLREGPCAIVTLSCLPFHFREDLAVSDGVRRQAWVQ